MTLALYCAGMVDALSVSPPDRFIATFLAGRYDLLSDLYPHEPFSVSEGTPTFFTETLTYLTSGIPECRPGTTAADAKHDVYWRRYRDWMRRHRDNSLLPSAA